MRRVAAWLASRASDPGKGLWLVTGFAVAHAALWTLILVKLKAGQPWVAIATLVVAMLPHLTWLKQVDFVPLTYAGDTYSLTPLTPDEPWSSGLTPLDEAMRSGFVGICETGDWKLEKCEAWMKAHAANAERIVITTRRFFAGMPGPATAWNVYIVTPAK